MKKAVEDRERQRVNWLLEFLRRDLTTLREGERLDLEADVVRFLRDPAAMVPTSPPDGYTTALARRRGEPPSAPKAASVDLEALQTALRSGVGILGKPGVGLVWKVFEGETIPVFEPQTDGTIARKHQAPLFNVLVAAGADVLVAWWPQLRRCEYEPCSALFLPKEGRQRFHDPKCSGLARWHRLPKPKRDYKQELIRQNERECAARKRLGKGKK